MTCEETRAILSGMSTGGELVLTSHTSYVQSRKVHGITPVMVLDARKAVATPNLCGQYYRRSDALVIRAYSSAPSFDRRQVWRPFTVRPYSSNIVSGLITNNKSLGTSALLRARV